MSEQTAQKRPRGRPSGYDPAFCDRVIELAKEGAGWAEYAAEFEIDRATLYKWADQYEDFRTALNRAKVHEQVWWEQQGRLNIKSKDFNTALWIKSAQARFRDDYTERKETALTGANGGAVQIETRKVDTDALEPEQREALRELILAAKGAK